MAEDQDLELEDLEADGKTAAPDGEPVQMAPHPHVAQNQSDAHEQQPQQRAAGRRADTDFVHLAIAGLDAEAFAVGLGDPPERPRTNSPMH